MATALALVNADVWTMAARGHRAQALLVERGRLDRVGEEATILRAAHARGAAVVDLDGRRVLPGLIDSHAHLVHQGLLQQRPNLSDTTSKDQALARVRAAARRHRGNGPLIAERWDESRWRTRDWPQRDELDAITRRFPLILRRVDGHIAVANTPALAALEPRLRGVDRARGLLIEEASLNLNQVWPTEPPQATNALALAQAAALRLGITTVHDFVVPNYLRAYQRLHAARRLELRVQATPYVEQLDAAVGLGVQTGLGNERLRLGGVKIFADGSLGGHTAALREPYTDQPSNRGRLNWSTELVDRAVATATRAHLQPSVHAIGDAAIDQVVAAYRNVPATRRRTLRPRIEHFELHHPEHVTAARELGLVLSMQPNFVGAWGRKGGLYHSRLGSGRYRRHNEFRRILAAGAHLAFGSDGLPMDPWYGLEATVRAPHAAQRLRPEEALRAYTIGSAFGIHREDDLGSLERGKCADLLVVEGQWAKPQGLARTRVQATMVGGAWVAGRPPPSR